MEANILIKDEGARRLRSPAPAARPSRRMLSGRPRPWLGRDDPGAKPSQEHADARANKHNRKVPQLLSTVYIWV